MDGVRVEFMAGIGSGPVFDFPSAIEATIKRYVLFWINSRGVWAVTVRYTETCVPAPPPHPNR
jgi:hypothetical protein